MIKYFFVLICFVLAQLIEQNDLFDKPKNWPAPFYDFEKNKLTKEKILLGRVLFYDPILSKDSTISCNSCHSPFSAFTHVDHALSHGIRDSIGIRNSPALMNLAWQKHFMWDGAINNLDMQSLAPISHPAEMGSNINDVVAKLNRSKIYKKLYKEAYKDSLITGEHTLKAIAQFMLTIISCNSKYDKVMNNKETFTMQEQNGYQIFKKHCSSCHTEPLFTNGEFANNGLALDSLLNDKGRARITQKKEDAYQFKVPTLRNIEFSYPYMHDGRFKKLKDVLNHYTNGIKKSETLDAKLQNGIILTSNEKVDLMAFLLTLSDKEFLFDVKFSYPIEASLMKVDQK
jgi:cytochrome c peroxidase